VYLQFFELFYMGATKHVSIEEQHSPIDRKSRLQGESFHVMFMGGSRVLWHGIIRSATQRLEGLLKSCHRVKPLI